MQGSLSTFGEMDSPLETLDTEIPPYCTQTSYGGALCRPCQEYRLFGLFSKSKDSSGSHEPQELMVERRRELLYQMNSVHDPVFGKLPPELVALIFQFCAPGMPFDTQVGREIEDTEENILDEARACFRAPLALLAVSHAWRHAAISTPQLWQYMLVRLDLPKLGSYTVLIHEWLRRSHNLPLSIRAFCTEDTVETAAITKVIDLINQESDRWEVLDLRMSANLAQRFGDNHPRQSTVLRSLRLEPQPYWANARIGFRMQGIKPSPTSVILCKAYQSVDISWDNVTWLITVHPLLDDCFQLLRQSPRLRYWRLCEISFDRRNHRDPFPLEFFTHSEIEDFAFEYPDGELALFFFNWLCLPALRTLVIKQFEDLDRAPLISFLKRSLCPLAKLTIQHAYFITRDIVSLLKILPSLIELTLIPDDPTQYQEEVEFGTTDFLTLLAKTSVIGDDPSPFLPNLQFLHYKALEVFKWELVLPVFGPISRLDDPSCRPLERFHLEMSREIHESYTPAVPQQFLLDLRVLEEAGLQFLLLPRSRNQLIEDARQRFDIWA
ncbi:hypothetical protein CVT26_005796 [Gymnopilus dilepis]|uniref:F-box domain-containing protein n=1 Tax=Gymnopilus dilepis TaxID=231916 RepID=A0A409YL53_9AGAR|nr:hypothetical protein CVT26_005796 [Gymnopilus dilepis]